MAELSKRTGVSRRTIYNYLSLGLLPAPEKSGGGGAVFTEEHVRLTEEISRYRRRGIPAEEIRRLVRARQAGAAESATDLEVELDVDLRRRIIECAARQFAAKGYRKTRVTDIVRELGIAPGTLYRMFPTKRKLLLETASMLTETMVHHMERSVRPDPDFVSRNLTRSSGFLGLRVMSPDMLTFLRAESLGDDSELREIVKCIYGSLVEGPSRELRELAAGGDEPPPLDPELLAFAFIGIGEAVVMRMSWDDKYSPRDYYQLLLALMVGSRAILAGEPRLVEEIKAYTDLVERLARSEPPVL
jgi:AcrR family transcriptional regulator